MTVGSLFSGIGGLDLGLEWAGFETKWFCEIEPFPQAVLKKHWPGVPIYDDVRTINANTVVPVDVIAGGFPCQDISWAGKGRGIDYDLSEQEGTRSGLWWEMWRVIRDLRPRYVIAENVPALTHRGLDIVLGSLAEIGYDAEWQTVSAAWVGAPHIRERVFIVAYPTGARAGRGTGGVSEKNGRQGKRVWQSFESGEALVAHGDNAGLEGRVALRERGGQRPAGTGGSQPDWFAGPIGQPWPVSFKELEGNGNVADTKSRRRGVPDPVDDGEGQGQDDSPRDRSEILADTEGERPGEAGQHCERPKERSSIGGDVCNPDNIGTHRRGEARNGRGQPEDAGEPGEWVEVEYDFRGVAHGVSDRVGALKGYGNAVVPQVGYLVGRAVMAHAKEMQSQTRMAA